MLHGNLGCVLHLVQILAVKLCKRSGCHGTGGADLCLAATLGTGDRGIALGKVTDDTGGGKTTNDLLVGEAPGILGILQHRRHDAAGTAGGRGDDGAVVRVLLSYSICVGGDPLEFQQAGMSFLRLLLQKELSLALHIQTAGQGAGGGKTVFNGLLHDLPHFH